MRAADPELQTDVRPARRRSPDGRIEVLEQATAAGARYLGLHNDLGVLRKGALADVILLRATDLNMAPLNVTDGQVVLCAQPSNVDTVFIDGQLRKRDGELLGIDTAAVVRDATAAVAGLRERVGVPLT